MPEEMSPNFQRISAALSQILSELDSPEKFWLWFESRDMLSGECKSLFTEMGSQVHEKGAAVAFGFMVGWETHAEAVSRDANS